jgi:hypothetical protein
VQAAYVVKEGITPEQVQNSKCDNIRVSRDHVSHSV